MKLTAKYLWIAGAIAVVLVGVVLGLLFPGDYATTQTARRAFTIDQDFTDVRKILVRNESAKEIVTMGGDSEFISQQWTAGGAELGKIELLNPDWKLELHGTLRVRTSDPYIGEHVLPLEQEVQIVPDRLHSEVNLNEPAERLRQYAMTTDFSRAEGDRATRVELELTQEILTRAPWFAHGIADRRVRQSAEQTLANQEVAIRRLIEENIDDVPLLPLR